MEQHYSFPRKCRLHVKKEIDTIFREGIFRPLGLIGSKSLRTNLGYSRFLIAVNRRVGSAPFRNRIKRLIREAIRLRGREFRQSYDICFFVTRPPREKVTFDYIDYKIGRLFSELNQQPHASKDKDTSLRSF